VYLCNSLCFERHLSVFRYAATWGSSGKKSVDTSSVPCSSVRYARMEIKNLFGMIRRCHGDNRVLGMRAERNEMAALLRVCDMA
jgi:hypothetical protein